MSAGRRRLWTLLAAAWALRVVLALRGGQLLESDEHRFGHCFVLFDYLATGRLGQFLDELRSVVHVGFVILGLPVALIRFILALSVSIPGVWPSLDGTLRLSAVLLSLWSVACIYLVHALALKAGAGRRESMIAAALMAGANCFLYFSRHLLPYDAATALCLWGLLLGLDPNPSFRRSLGVGFLLGFGFMTHHGHWPLIPLFGGVHAFYGRPSRAQAARRALAMALTGPLLLEALCLLSWVRGGVPYPVMLKGFLATSSGANAQNYGDFAEGWSLPFEYLWHSEHLIFLLWLLAAVAGLRRGRKSEKRALLWAGLAGGIYGLLAVSSTLLHAFVVYGRLARQTVPFLCLAAAFGIEEAWRRRPPPIVVWAASGALLAQAAYNARPVLEQRFPIDIRRQAVAEFGPVGLAQTIDEGSTRQETGDPASLYVLVNARHFFPVMGVEPPPAGRELFRTPHPLEFLPLQYEGYGRKARAILRANDISIRLIRLTARAARPSTS